MKTLEEITTELANAGLPLSQRTVRRKLQDAGLAPVSQGLRPVRWPAWAASSILTRAGARELAANPAGIPTLKALRAVAPKTRNGRPRHD